MGQDRQLSWQSPAEAVRLRAAFWGPLWPLSPCLPPGHLPALSARGHVPSECRGMWAGCAHTAGCMRLQELCVVLMPQHDYPGACLRAGARHRDAGRHRWPHRLPEPGLAQVLGRPDGATGLTGTCC